MLFARLRTYREVLARGSEQVFAHAALILTLLLIRSSTLSVTCLNLARPWLLLRSAIQLSPGRFSEAVTHVHTEFISTLKILILNRLPLYLDHLEFSWKTLCRA
jgi:hypothetical protein